MAARQRALYVGILLAALLACAQLGQLTNTCEAAFAARNQQVGYRACVHLMLRLVDCLIDACDLYLRDTSAAPDADMAVGLTGGQQQAVVAVVGAIGPVDLPPEKAPSGKAGMKLERPEKNIMSQPPGKDIDREADMSGKIKSPTEMKGKIASPSEPNSKGKIASKDQPKPEAAPKGKRKDQQMKPVAPEVDEKEPKQKQKSEKKLNDDGEMKPKKSTTTPAATGSSKSFLSWLTGVDTCELESNNAKNLNSIEADEDELTLSINGCPVNTIKQLREQLVKLRTQLSQSDKVSLAQVLRRFVELNSSLRKDCPLLPETNYDLPVRKLDSLSYIMETIQVLAQLADAAQIQEGLEQAGDERAATETIKQQYAYLTQIITAYNLVFNAVDTDLMGDLDLAEGDDAVAVKKADKSVANSKAAKPLLEVDNK